MKPIDIKNKVGSNIFDAYTKITNVRNPFDILVSHYHFKPTNHIYSNGLEYSFEEYILETKVVDGLSNDFKDLLFIDDKFVINEIIRFENLNEDLNNLVSKLNLPTNNRELKHYKKSLIREGKNYTEYYNTTTKKIVEDKFKFYLDMFNYNF
jgi:hypothetical protein